MALYDYKCTNCPTTTEISHKMLDESKHYCPNCSSEMNKLISPTSFKLKGEGWYTSGYSAKSAQNK
jgi:putative FmdB family regulatory protein